MATPQRLVQLRCPACNATFWQLDSDWRGVEMLGQRELTYSQREYRCTSCNRSGSGYTVVAQSPPEFLLQPHPMYPMTASDFEYWVGVLREHFPDHSKLRGLGSTFYPNLPGLPTATVEMWHEEPRLRPQCTLDPKLDEVAEWLRRLGPNAQLTLEYKRGLKLTLTRPRSGGGINASCADSRAVIAKGEGLSQERVLTAVAHFLRGDGDGCLWAIAPRTSSGSEE